MIIETTNAGCYAVYPFSGIPTFLRSKEIRDLKDLEETPYDIAVLGVPMDQGMPFQPGTRFGPRGLREQSLRYNKRGYYSVDDDKIYLTKELQEDRIVDMGDVSIVPTDVIGNIEKTTDMVRRILRKKRDGHTPLMVTMGGDHSITAPVVRGFDELDKKIHVIHFDAHPDYAEIQPGFEHTNAHPFRHVKQMDHIASLTQVGIRSARAFQARDSREDGNRVVGMKEFRRLGPDGIAAILPKGEPCYISIDIDSLDCSLIPGCVSAEPNGLMFDELTDSLAAVAKQCEVVGFDLVCIAPDLDVPTKITSSLGTQIMVQLLGQICEQDYWKARYAE